MHTVQPAAEPLQRYVKQVRELGGVAGCCVFEIASGHAVAHAAAAGAEIDAAALAQQGRTLLAAMADAGRSLGLGAAASEAAVTVADHQLLLRALPKHPGLALHALLDGSANPTLVRLQLQRLDASFDEPRAAR